MLICLPGMASRVKRAATSATRSAPFATTMNCTTVMIRKITRPTARLPPTTNSPNVWMIAAGIGVQQDQAGASIDSASRNSVVIRITDGSTDSSSGLRR